MHFSGLSSSDSTGAKTRKMGQILWNQWDQFIGTKYTVYDVINWNQPNIKITIMAFNNFNVLQKNVNQIFPTQIPVSDSK